MKTCTNPKCNATGIPDDAMFCPVCGEALVETSDPWKEKYDAFMKEREELLIKKKQLSLFETARQKMYSTLKQDSNFEASMQDNREIIKANRESELHPLVKWSFAILLIGICILVIGLALTNNPVMVIGGIAAGISFLFMLIGLALSAQEQVTITNQYITNFLYPFIEGHRKDYSDAGVNKADYGILEDEIVEPEKISQMIAQKIEEIAKQLINIEYQMQLMQQMK